MNTSEDRAAPADDEATAAPVRFVICGVDELARFRQSGLSHIVSIMDPGSVVPEAFGSFDAHERLDLRFHDIIDEKVDMIIPSGDHIGQLLRFGDAMTAAKSPVKLLVHCHAGVSRSSAATVLLLARRRPDAPEQALAQLLSVAPNAWPNLRMIEIGDALLDCRGRLISAVRAHYASMLERYPAIRQLIATDRHLRVPSGQALRASSSPRPADREITPGSPDAKSDSRPATSQESFDSPGSQSPPLHCQPEWSPIYKWKRQ